MWHWLLLSSFREYLIGKVEILLRRNQIQSRFPEETNSCHLVISLFEKRSDICSDIVNSVFVSKQYITYWIHFGYLPCRGNSDEETWNISSKREDSSSFILLSFYTISLVFRWTASPSCVHPHLFFRGQFRKIILSFKTLFVCHEFFVCLFNIWFLIWGVWQLS